MPKWKRISSEKNIYINRGMLPKSFWMLFEETEPPVAEIILYSEKQGSWRRIWWNTMHEIGLLQTDRENSYRKMRKFDQTSLPRSSKTTYKKKLKSRLPGSKRTIYLIFHFQKRIRQRQTRFERNSLPDIMRSIHDGGYSIYVWCTDKRACSCRFHFHLPAAAAATATPVMTLIERRLIRRTYIWSYDIDELSSRVSIWDLELILNLWKR